jgi:stage II sporulation protein AA (anti-sigma F factor antagonist)
MEIAAELLDGVLLLSPQGRLDSHNSPELERRALLEIGGGAKRLVIDLSAIDYISSAGLRAFLAVAKKLKEPPGRLVLCGMAPSVRQIFDLAGFSPIFAIEAARDAAHTRAAAP